MDDLKSLGIELELKSLVIELEKKSGHNEQIRILQEINEKLLTKYYIIIGGIEIRPLRVEAYYFYPGKFEDSTVHGDPQQRKFGVLYRHEPDKEIIYTEKDNGGVDLCLAYSESGIAPYFLSFLIKNSWVKTPDSEGFYCKQIELNAILNKRKNDMNNMNDIKVTFATRENDPQEDVTVFHTVRKGLSGKPFGREPLASLININRKNPNDPSKSIFDFAAGCGKEQILAEYLWNNPEKDDPSNREKWYGSKSEPSWKRKIGTLTKKLTKN